MTTPAQHPDSFRSAASLTSGATTVRLFRLQALAESDPTINLARLPYSLRILLENLLRHEDGRTVTADDINFLAHWDPKAEPSREIAFMPARVLMQDFTGVPAIVDLAAMRDAMRSLGGDPERINPLQPAELVIDHSVQVDEFGSPNAYDLNAALEFSRNRERYAFLKWGQSAFRNFSAVPPGMGICHQVNLEHLARVVFTTEPDADGAIAAYPDTLVGTDSHTTMVNGLGVLGWGVGGIEAEAAMLGQSVSMLIPQVVGFRLTGKLHEGTTATDLVLTVTEALRKHGVVGKFVEFFGPGISELPLADRATIANMAPEYGATCGIFPVDAETLKYLRLTGRTEAHIALVEAYFREQGLFHTAASPEAEYSSTLSLDLATVEPSVAGPRRPQDRVLLSQAAASFAQQLPALLGPNGNQSAARQVLRWETEGGHASANGNHEGSLGASDPHAAAPASVKARFGVDPDPYLDHGSIVIAAITSCTNTSNPYVMIAAGLLAKKAVEKRPPHSPLGQNLPRPRLPRRHRLLQQVRPHPLPRRPPFQYRWVWLHHLHRQLRPLPTDVSKSIEDHGLVAVSVLSGNRNFEGRISPEVRANYLMSPPLVVAYALAGHIFHNFATEPLGKDQSGAPVYLKDIWPTQAEVSATVAACIDSQMFRKQYSTVSQGDQNWQNLKFPDGDTYHWEPDSTYIRRAPYFDGIAATPAPIEDIRAARCLAVLGDSVTTDHISPAGSIKKNGPAGHYLAAHGVAPADFNSYGSRRGNHEVMVRGTFANVRLRNKLAPGTEGGVTRLLPEGTTVFIYDASVIYAERGVPLCILAGKEYGSGSSRDWAAKGPRLLGIKFVIAESYERIHRSNLVGMGILPFQFLPGQSAASLGLTGEEIFAIGDAPGQLQSMLDSKFADGRILSILAETPAGRTIEFSAILRIDTPQEVLYYQHGGILPYVLRQLVGNARST